MIEVQPPEGAILRAFDWRVQAYSRETISGFADARQIVASPVERWTARLTWRVVKRDRLDEWRGFVADMRGRLNYCRFRPSSLAAGLWAATGGQTFDDGTLFDDGTGFAAEGEVAAAAGQLAREIRISVASLTGWKRGMVFGIGSTAYMATSVEITGATTATVRIAPGLRAAAAAGAPLLPDPSIPMRFASDAEGALSWSPEQYGDAGAELIEAFP